MQPKAFETYRQMANRVYGFHKSLDWKAGEANGCLRVCGYSELVIGSLPDLWFTKIRKAFQRGYVTGKGPGWPVIMKLIEDNQHVSVGYIGRVEMRVYLPETSDAPGLVERLETMYQLETNSRGTPFHIDDHDCYAGEARIVSRLSYDQSIISNGRRMRRIVPPPALFSKLRHLIELELKESLPHRQKVLDWLDSRPTLRVPFASHSPNGDHRG